MTARNLYLKPNVLVDPLFNQWYAWSNLIAAATSSMYVANLHLKRIFHILGRYCIKGIPRLCALTNV
jgi:hypothetical protein